MGNTLANIDASAPLTAPSRWRSGFTSLFGAIPPTGLLILSISSVQLGAALAKTLFATLGPTGTVALRVGFAALVLALISRPRLRGYTRAAYLKCIGFGFALAAMNLCFYSALSHIPLGVAVTLEFVGPLSVAVVQSRGIVDVIWVALAASGIVALAPFTGAHLNPTGFALALMAGGCWAVYIVLSAKVGQAVPGSAGLVIAMSVSAIILVPIGFATTSLARFTPGHLLLGLCIALLSSAIPYSLELEALRRLPTRVFGLLMSMEPAMAALMGLIILGEAVTLRAVAAIVLITAATVGTILGHRKRGPLI